MSSIYLDSCLVIYYIERHAQYGNRVESLIASLTATDEICSSPLTLLECLVHPLRSRDIVLEQRFRQFLGKHRQLAMTLAVFDTAAQLRATTNGLKTPDALHLATAIHYGCSEFWTNDDRLQKAAPLLVRNIC